MNERELSRATRSFIEKAQFWLKKPRGLSIRWTEHVLSRGNLFELLLTRNSKDNLSIDLDFIFSNLVNGKELIPARNKAEFRMFTLDNILVSPKSGIMKLPSHHIFAPLHSDREFFGGNKADEVAKLQLSAIKNQSKKLDGTFFVLPMQTYYYHFIVDELPRIIQIVFEYPDAVIITAKSQPSFVTDFLRDAGIRFQFEDSPLWLQETLICIPTSFKPCKEKIQIIRNYLINLYKGDSSVEEFFPQPFFVSRSDSRRRYSQNTEELLISQLSQSGGQVLRPGQMSLKEQVLKFHQVRNLHGLHGSGLVNMIFMQPGGTVHEYVMGEFVPYFYRELSELCGHEYSVDRILKK